MKAVERQYATYFDWNGKTANTFFKLFGEPLGVSMKENIKKDPELKAGCDAFLGSLDIYGTALSIRTLLASRSED